MEEESDGRGSRRRGMSEHAAPSRGHGLAIQIPSASPDTHASSSAKAADQTQLPSPLPTPSMPMSAPSAPNSTVLATIHSDDDSCTSDASSQSHRGRLHSSESSSLSETAHDGSPDKVAGGSGAAQSQPMRKANSQDNVRRLSAAEMQQFVEAPESLPVAVVTGRRSPEQGRNGRLSPSELQTIRQSILGRPGPDATRRGLEDGGARVKPDVRRPPVTSRTLSTPPISRKQPATHQTSPRRNSFNPGAGARPSNLRSLPNTPILKPPASTGTGTGASAGTGSSTSTRRSESQDDPALLSPVRSSIPMPPMSLPTHLQLELAAQRPSQLYIHQPENINVPYESAAIKLERLLNVLLLPTYLERTIIFGALACLDAWLYSFTILPMRFLMAVGILVKWWGHVFVKEVKWVTGFVWYGLGRLWIRGRRKGPVPPSADATPVPSDDDRVTSASASARNGDSACAPLHYDSSSSRGPFSPQEATVPSGAETAARSGRVSARNSAHKARSRYGVFRHRRTKSMPSNLTAYNKADLLQGLVILFSSIAMMKLDASRMYHFIRGQSDIKLYVIYNILEIGDRLLSALGQDIFECLFSAETLSRNSSGRSKVLFPMGMFLLALTYNILHSVSLYFHVITLNVAVNSYSNALVTLLMSNQFVEVKSTVFKRIEKDNLFQLTCADIVERFQLWIMLLIIGMRNVVEVGGLSVPGAGAGSLEPSSTVPLHSPTILPHSFTVLPSWVWSGEVLSPFFIVLGSEIFVDSIKHAYVTKFNNIKRTFYSRTLDILCKDYYTNAFVTPTLTRRLGLAVIPLSCLFIRASFQTYHMFLSTHLSPPLPPSTQTSLSEESAVPSSPAITAALDRFDTLLRDALGRSVYGQTSRQRSWWDWTKDDVIAALTMVVVFFLVFLVLLMVKLVLGMALLHFSRNRYANMMRREQAVAQGKAEREKYEGNSKRVGPRGEVEVGEERRRWIHLDETEGLKRRPKPEKAEEPDGGYQGVSRYEMVAKRIW